jgi:hypothetical protein
MQTQIPRENQVFAVVWRCDYADLHAQVNFNPYKTIRATLGNVERNFQVKVVKMTELFPVVVDKFVFREKWFLFATTVIYIESHNSVLANRNGMNKCHGYHDDVKYIPVYLFFCSTYLSSPNPWLRMIVSISVFVDLKSSVIFSFVNLYLLIRAKRGRTCEHAHHLAWRSVQIETLQWRNRVNLEFPFFKM